MQLLQRSLAVNFVLSSCLCNIYTVLIESVLRHCHTCIRRHKAGLEERLQVSLQLLRLAGSAQRGLFSCAGLA